MGLGGAFLLAAGLALLLGAGVVLLGLRGLRDTQRLRARGIRVPGVVAYFKDVVIDEGYELRPVLRFRTLDGQDIETVSVLSPRPRRGQNRPGLPVIVVYDPARPTSAVAGGVPRGADLSGILAVVVGSSFFMFGLIFLVISIVVLTT